jgi:hypothetical protein
VIPTSHLRALGERLDRDGRVEFKNGSVVSVESGTDLRIDWPETEEYGYVNNLARDQLGRAYTLAMTGAPEPAPPPPARIKPQRGDGSKFGDCPF